MSENVGLHIRKVSRGQQPSAQHENKQTDAIQRTGLSGVDGLIRNVLPGGTTAWFRESGATGGGQLALPCTNVDSVTIPAYSVVQTTGEDTSETTEPTAEVQRPEYSSIQSSMAWVIDPIAVGATGVCYVGGAMIVTVVCYSKLFLPGTVDPADFLDADFPDHNTRFQAGRYCRPMKNQFVLSIGQSNGFAFSNMWAGTRQQQLNNTGPFVIRAVLDHVSSLQTYLQDTWTHPKWYWITHSWGEAHLCLVTYSEGIRG